jgi:hypothetical protein
MANEEDYEPGPDDGIHDPGDYKPAYTSGAAGRVVVGEVAILRAEVQALRHQVAACEADNTRLREVLQAIQVKAAFAQIGASLLVGVLDKQEERLAQLVECIGAALAGDSPDESSGPQESRTPQADH